ncbi:lactose regulatory protein LAC9 [Colletotrichum asianum]|uniref:Lactose regulatory protein LAC9 n=1 Tax=Colletotrichum asianum TaxID=702518 RepID=A0A8H3W6U8_9PEZI|nr:lactose regulatory protein LAC9 [Colletotrichum asianum]
MKSSPVEQVPATKRASCDRCREKKVRCDGKGPKCGRCARFGAECFYSIQKPIGRPPRRKICACGVPTPMDDPQADTSEPPPRTQHSAIGPSSDHTPSTATLAPTSAAYTRDAILDQINQATNHSISSTNTLYEEQAEAGLDTVSEDGGVLITTAPSPDKAPLGSTAAPSNQSSCACLASLYLMLDQMQANEEMAFPSGLHFLRGMMVKARDIIHCPICPTRFLSATQNMPLLGGLMMSIARQCGIVLEAIESEATTATRLNHTKAIEFQGLGSDGVVSLPDAPSHVPVSNVSGGFSVQMHPLEWMILANKAVKTEIYGLDGASKSSFMGLLEVLEERQGTWHSSPRSQDYAHYANGADRPTCIRIIDEVRRLMGVLKLEDSANIDPMMQS